jgi:ADP-ribose pyrophosphatase YjhB (NUDIX family)
MSSTRLIDLFARDVGYATPKVDVRAAVFSDEGLLLVRERSDGAWTLSGGWADVGDSPSMAAVREVKEQSGYDVAARKLIDRSKSSSSGGRQPNEAPQTPL